MAALAMVAFSSSAPAWSQESPQADQTPVAQQAPVALAQAESADAGLKEAAASDALALKALQTRIEELEARAADQETVTVEDTGGEATSFKPSLSMYGFMTLSLTRSWVQANNAMNNIVHEEASFTFSNVNLFFQSRMTQSLSALVELYFTFAPHGNETFNPYQRQDTTVTETSTLRQRVLGGVAIERAQATWQRYDAFGLTVGRFITPYGVWNVEHSPTIYLPMVLPLSMVPSPLLPTAQTGLMVHGRFFPHTGTYIDYAITAANNRSDVEASLDFNDNKALGLRVQLCNETLKFSLSLGGNGYKGHVDIRKKTDQIDLSVPTIRITSSSVDKHTELSGSFDVVLKVFGARLQAEYTRSILKYDVHPLRMAPFYNVPVTGDGYVPDHTRWAGYVMLAYEIPLKKLLDDTTLTPWAMLERSEFEDSNPDYDANDFRAGLTFKPSSYWVIKVEGATMWAPESKSIKSNIYFAGAQAAVSF
ncbi:MAG: hypothetical protein MUC50_08385 [Myxococcota bacterium]|nr:hypothetical protein [Myxococcota bacterium]